MGAGARPRLIGRDPELASLLTCLDRAISGQGQVVFLTGEAGIGKTALAAEFLAQAEAAGHRTVTGQAFLAEGQAAFAVVVDAVRDGLRRQSRAGQGAIGKAGEAPFLAGSAAAANAIGLGDDKARLFEQGYEFFVRLIPARGALIVFLDDLHWADTAALEFVHYLGRNLRGDRLLLIVSYRREELNRQTALPQTLASLRRQGRTTELLLRPLSRAEAGHLAQQTLPPASERGGETLDDLVDRVYERARGNPLYFLELLRALATDSPARNLEAACLNQADPGSLPQLIQDVIQSRLIDLPPAGRRSLDLAAAIGPVVPYAVWQAAAGVPEPILLEAIEPLCRLDLLRERTGVPELTFEFAHPLIRDAVYGAVSPPRRRQAHRQIADALLASYGPEDPEHLVELSYHLARTGDRTRQAKAVGIFQRAGDRALAGYANREAAAHYRLALEHLPVADLPSESRLDALEGLGRALNRLGDLDGAIQAWDEARTGWLILGQPQRAAALRRRIGVARRHQGDPRAAIAAFQAGLDLLGTSRITVEAADLHQELATVWHSLGDLEAARREGRAAADLAERLGAGAVAARTFSALLALHASAGDRAQARAYTAQALDYAESAGAKSVTWRVHNTLGWLAIEFGETDEAERHLAVALETARAVGSPTLEVWPLTWRAALRLQTGDWTPALDDANRAVALARRALQAGALPVPLVVAGTLRWLLGEAEAGWELVDEAGSLIEPVRDGDHYLRCLVLGGRAFLHLLSGEHRPAFDLARQATDLVEARRMAPLYLTHRSGLPTLIEAALELGDAGTAAARQAQLEDLAGRLDHRPALAQAARLRGRLATLKESPKDAEVSFAESLVIWRELGHAYEQARTLRDMGRKRRAFGDREGALAVFREALTIFERLGAQRDADAARAALRALGARPNRRRPAGAAHGLTGREIQIVRLIADRRTNRAIADALVISPLTVETHVHNILKKLDLPSRTLIPAWASERGLLQ